MRARGGLPIRRVAIAIAALVALAGAAPASAAVPTLGAVEATNIQGVSALLKGTVDPEGLTTTYRFEYGTQASFAGAAKTPATAAGAGTEPLPARAAISGLAPNTTYHYRLLATNSSGTATGTPATFTTTQGFGFLAGTAGFGAAAIADGGAASTQTASHPYQLNLTVGLRLGGEFEGQPGVDFPDGDLRELAIEMPPGLIVNPSVLEECTQAQFHTPRSSPFEQSRSGESCPRRTQAGTVEVKSSLGGGQSRRFGLFNLDPVPGAMTQLGFAPYGSHVVFDVALRPNPDGSYVLTLVARGISQSLDLSGIELALWGTPWAASHNGERGNCLNETEPDFPWAKCTVGEPLVYPPQAYLSLPATCSSSLAFTATASSWQQPGQVSRGALNRDSGGQPAALGSCANVPFDPAPVGFLTTNRASSASGFNFRLTVEDEGLTEPTVRAAAPTRRAVITLPEGVSVNPSVGAGLGSCTPARFAAETAFSVQGAGCPNASKIGEFSVRTPLFEGWMEGAAYLAAPFDNPFGELIALYLVARSPQRGVLIKIAGKIVPDPVTGDLIATFEGLPQLPYTDLDLTFHTGQRAFLITPPRCGVATTRIELTPWSGGPSARSSTDSQIQAGVGGGPCPAPGAPPFNPQATAGGVNSNANSYTPYFIHLTRTDTEQELTSYSLVLPKGITGKLAGVPFCSEAAIAAARNNGGFAETANPSCPAASQVGRTLTGYGVGAALSYAAGRIYLAGPYRGSPLSLITVNAATVGPFDLGTVVIRSAFDIDPRTAQLRIDSTDSDPIPHILRGIPLHLRDVRVYMDRPEFTHNPSSCLPAALVSTLTGAGARFDDPSDDSTATVAKHFQLLNCLTLGFKPKLGLRLRGPARRGAYPALRATFAARGQRDSNLKRMEINMPRSLFLAQNHIRKVCTQVQFAAERCPGGSIYGSAVAYTPLLDGPLRGKVYLRSSKNKLPDLVTSLFSGAVRIDLVGRIGPSKAGGIRAFFDNLPDAPINRFVMRLRGGRRGLLVNSVNICANPPRASVKALGQNNRGWIFTSKLRGQCKKKGKKKGKKRRAAISVARATSGRSER